MAEWLLPSGAVTSLGRSCSRIVSLSLKIFARLGINQLPHIAGPFVPSYRVDRSRLDFPARAEKMSHQQRDIAFPLSKRRELQRHHIDPIVKILAKSARLNLLRQVAIRRGAIDRYRKEFRWSWRSTSFVITSMLTR